MISKRIQQQLAQYGYCRLPKLDAELILPFQNWLEAQLKGEELNGFFPSMFFQNQQLRLEIEGRLNPILSEYAKPIFPDYRCLYTNVLFKSPGEGSFFKPHQDWTYVDESKADSLAIWIPLTKLTEQNGALYFLPGSHLHQPYLRGPAIDDPLQDQWPINDFEPQYLEKFEGVAWNHKTYHYSAANQSAATRIAITAILVPEQVKTHHYFRKPNGDNHPIEHYETDTSFYVNYNLLQPEQQYFKGNLGYIKPEFEPYKMKVESVSRAVFHDEAKNLHFHSQGYQTIDLLNPDELIKLDELINELNEKRNDETWLKHNYGLSFFSSNHQFRAALFDAISSMLQPAIDRHIAGYKPLIVNVFDKKPGGDEVPVHQNWTFVDESRYRSISIWIPLCDVDANNGSLNVLPASHLFLSAYRGPNIPWQFEEFTDVIRNQYMRPFAFSAGVAGVIDDAILHFSGPNKSNQTRRAVQVIMIPEEAAAIHYFSDQRIARTMLEVGEVNPEFFIKFQGYKRPTEVPLIRKLELHQPPLTKSAFDELAQRYLGADHPFKQPITHV